MPMALYGIEMTRGCKSSIDKLKAAIADAIGSRSARSSQLGSFEVQQCKRDVDPEIVAMVRRVSLVRRQINKKTDVGDVIKLPS